MKILILIIAGVLYGCAVTPVNTGYYGAPVYRAPIAAPYNLYGYNPYSYRSNGYGYGFWGNGNSWYHSHHR
jgi:hypothetical protein